MKAGESNPKRNKFIKHLQENLDQAHGIDPVITGIVVTAVIGEMRQSISCGGFERLAGELYEIAKPEQRPDTHKIF